MDSCPYKEVEMNFSFGNLSLLLRNENKKFTIFLNHQILLVLINIKCHAPFLLIRLIVSHICVPKKKDIAGLNEYDTKRLVH